MKKSFRLLAIGLVVVMGLGLFAGCSKKKETTELTLDNVGEYFDVAVAFENVALTTDAEPDDVIREYWHQGQVSIRVTNKQGMTAEGVVLKIKVNVECEAGWNVVEPKWEFPVEIPASGTFDTTVPYSARNNVDLSTDDVPVAPSGVTYTLVEVKGVVY